MAHADRPTRVCSQATRQESDFPAVVLMALISPVVTVGGRICPDFATGARAVAPYTHRDPLWVSPCDSPDLDPLVGQRLDIEVGNLVEKRANLLTLPFRRCHWRCLVRA